MHLHHVPKSMSCQNAIVVITGREHYFHDYIDYIYIYITPIYIYKAAHVCENNAKLYLGKGIEYGMRADKVFGSPFFHKMRLSWSISYFGQFLMASLLLLSL